MSIIEVFNKFQTQEQAIEYLEAVRWRGTPCCPYCGSIAVYKHQSTDRAMRRWQCRDCTRAFSVTVGTIFHGTRKPLRDWFILLALMLNAKKSVSSCQAARDLGIRRQTVWTMMQRIRVAMANDQEQAPLLRGIVEADETYVGGNPRNRRHRKDDDDDKPKRGRGTAKTPVVGVMERGGRVVARPARPDQLNAAGLSRFVGKHVEAAGTLMITDEYRGYARINETYLHETVNHSIEYGRGHVHTNNIEGFWALIKRAWYGTHHHYSKKYIGLYIAEACYKFNQRTAPPDFDAALGQAVA